MGATNHIRIWIFPAVFVPTFILTVIARGVLTGVWMELDWAVAVCSIVLAVWAACETIYRRYRRSC